ncbi:hypothetical protein [Halomarina oriensis]|nr:hypothetical protein [Halomarina oriensis]
MPYLVALGELVGDAITGVLGVGLAVVVFDVLAVRRRSRRATER